MRPTRGRRALLALTGLALAGSLLVPATTAQADPAGDEVAARLGGGDPAATAARVTGREVAKPRSRRGVRRVVFVGNNWDGTADVLAPGSFERIGRINIVPDRARRMREITANPYRLAFFLAIRHLIGEGHDQLVDDMYSSNDGRLLIVSRPSFADVVAISLETGEIEWRFPVAGERSDHMALSPDGTKVVVSASTGNVVHVLRVSDGTELGRIRSGGSPHESTFIDGGEKILHASIGMVYSPLDHPALDDTKQERVLQVIDADTYEVLRRYDLRAALDARGMTETSTAVRPITLSPDEETFYFQLSFLHGFVEMDRDTGEITRVKELPNLIPDVPREAYLLDSAHHGIAMNPAGTRLCVAGTMSDYVTMVDADTLEHHKLRVRADGKPYWVTPSWNGKHCYISWSGRDSVSKISYRTGRIVETTPVGYHPQRVRNGFLARDLVAGVRQGL